MEFDFKRFVCFGFLWWVFDVESVSVFCLFEENEFEVGKNRVRVKNGWVVLVDEIDKVDSDFFNGFFEVFGES